MEEGSGDGGTGTGADDLMEGLLILAAKLIPVLEVRTSSSGAGTIDALRGEVTTAATVGFLSAVVSSAASVGAAAFGTCGVIFFSSSVFKILFNFNIFVPFHIAFLLLLSLLKSIIPHI